MKTRTTIFTGRPKHSRGRREKKVHSTNKGFETGEPAPYSLRRGRVIRIAPSMILLTEYNEYWL